MGISAKDNCNKEIIDLNYNKGIIEFKCQHGRQKVDI